MSRLWRSLNHECVFLHAREAGPQAKAGIGRWITFYNHHRPRPAHCGQPPAVVCYNSIKTHRQVQAVARNSQRYVHGSGEAGNLFIPASQTMGSNT